MALVSLDNVTKKFGEITAVEKVSFKVDRGEFVFLIGPSGAGKTTILKHILKEHLPTGGKVCFEGEDLVKIKGRQLCELRKKIGIIFQDFRLLNNRTVFENVALPLEIRRMSPGKIKEEVEEILKKVGLAERKNLFSSQLAVGEIQRAALARAIVAHPVLLLADEPTGNLDPTTSKNLIDLLAQINKKGTTVIMATHNVQIVNEAKGRVILLKDGKVISDKKKGKYELNI